MTNLDCRHRFARLNKISLFFPTLLLPSKQLRSDESLAIAMRVLSGISPVADVRRIDLGWWAVILLLQPAITAIAASLDILFGGRGIRLDEADCFLVQPLTIFPYILFILFFGPIPE